MAGLITLPDQAPGLNQFLRGQNQWLRSREKVIALIKLKGSKKLGMDEKNN